MPRLVLALALLLTVAPAAVAQDWTTINLGTSEDLRYIEKTSFSQRYVVGTGGFVAQSNDGTQTTWTPINVGTSADLLAVHQPSFTQVWISGEAGTCIRLETGNWVSRNIPNASEDFVVFSRSSGWSYAGGSGGSIYRSTDAGVSWHLQHSGADGIRHGNGFVGSLAIAVGDNGAILKTTNGGNPWTPKPSGTTDDLHAYLDVANGATIAGGENGTVVRTVDGGETWSPVSTPTSATIYDLDTSGQSAFQVLAVGEGGLCMQSTDAGLTWCLIDTGTTTDLYCCDMVLNNTWVVAGAGGFMQRTENAGGGCFDPTGVEEAGIRSAFQLSGPWPQPLVDAGRFELQTARDQHVRADVIDVAGRRVAVLLDRRLGAGERMTLSLEAGAWPAGVYFLRVEGESFADTRKMVVVR